MLGKKDLILKRCEFFFSFSKVLLRVITFLQLSQHRGAECEASVILRENVKGRCRLGPKPAQAPCSSAPATVMMLQVTTLLRRKRTHTGWMHGFSRPLQPFFSPSFFFFSRGRGLLTAQQHVLLISSRVEVCVFTLKTHTQQLAGMPPSYSLTSACKTTCSNLFASCEKYSNLSLLLSPLQAKHVLLHYVLVSKAKAADTDPL